MGEVGCGVHAALTSGDEAARGSLDEARDRGLLFALAAATLVVVVFGGVGLSLHIELSESAACSRGLRWPRREVSGYWHKRCLFAHWLIISFKVYSVLRIRVLHGSWNMVRSRTRDGERVVIWC